MSVMDYIRECGHPYHRQEDDNCVECLLAERDRLRAALDIAYASMGKWRHDSAIRTAIDRIDQVLKEGIHRESKDAGSQSAEG